MVITQVRFRCVNEDNYKGGILVDYGEDAVIICGCCGGIIDNEDIEALERLPWVDISEEIKGE